MPINNNMSSQQIKNKMDEEKPKKSFLLKNWPTILILSVIGFYLVTEHQAHLLGALPWLILLACPFIHIFMHRGHGHGHGDHIHTNPNQKEVDDAK